MWHGENFKGEAWISVGNEHIVNICISYIDKIMEMFMEEKVPFYMTYPMQNLYSAELEYEKDMERVRELYPREIAFIQEAVEKHCDKLEYEGSRIYDEVPDSMMMQAEVDKILASLSIDAKTQEASIQEPQKKLYFEAVAQSYRPCRGVNDYLCSIVKILFGNEIYRRRCRHRRCRRFW